VEQLRQRLEFIKLSVGGLERLTVARGSGGSPISGVEGTWQWPGSAIWYRGA
jgi:hypothetical protein